MKTVKVLSTDHAFISFFKHYFSYTPEYRLLSATDEGHVAIEEFLLDPIDITILDLRQVDPEMFERVERAYSVPLRNKPISILFPPPSLRKYARIPCNYASFCCYNLSEIPDTMERLARLPTFAELSYYELYNMITEILLKIPIKPSRKGFVYLHMAAHIALTLGRKDPELVYPVSALLCKTNPRALERSIRTAVADAWKRASNEFKVENFGEIAAALQFPPTNHDFIFAISGIVERQMKNNSLSPRELSTMLPYPRPTRQRQAADGQ